MDVWNREDFTHFGTDGLNDLSPLKKDDGGCWSYKSYEFIIIQFDVCQFEKFVQKVYQES